MREKIIKKYYDDKKRNYIETNKRFFNVNRKKVFFKKREIKCEINLIDIKKREMKNIF